MPAHIHKPYTGVLPESRVTDIVWVCLSSNDTGARHASAKTKANESLSLKVLVTATQSTENRQF